MIHQDLLMATDPIQSILEQHIPSGLYQGEDSSCWAEFLLQVDHILKHTESPRNNIIRTMESNPEFQALLVELEIPWTTNLTILQERINLKFKTVIRQLSDIDGLTDQITDLERVDSPTRLRIIEQLSKQNKITVDTIIRNKKGVLLKKIEDLDTESPYFRLKPFMDRYHDQWNSVNLTTGTINQSKGHSLEQQQDAVIRHIEKQTGLKMDKTWTNCRWNDDLGEVDMILRLSDSSYVIVEYKSRVYDIRAAWYQNGPGRNPLKNTLILDGLPVKMGLDTRFYVVTTEPETGFVLPFESDLKRVMTYRLKHQCTPEQTWEYAKSNVFQTEPETPLDWYLRNKDCVILI